MNFHHDMLLKQAEEILTEILKSDDRAEGYIIRNVYGKVQIYIKTEFDDIIEKTQQLLVERIGDWLGVCEKYGENFYVQSQIEKWKKNSVPKNRIWFFEKYITNVYWDGKKRIGVKNLKSKLVSAYSFKGGVGRTTTLVLAALSLAKKGKKIVIIDFDLEAPGVSCLFPDESVSNYGLLDYLLESNVYANELSIDEYVYTVTDYCHVSQQAGDIYIMPAYGKVIKNDMELYRKALMRFDLDAPVYTGENTPIDFMLKKLDDFLHPDYIFIDTRSGIHQIGGITLTRYSDIALMFFYGSRQNIEGMQMTLPIMKSSDTNFLLINSKVPANKEVAELERNLYVEGSYGALSLCDEAYQNKEVLLDDKSAEHYPLDITFSSTLEVVDNIGQLLKAYEEQRIEIEQITDAIEEFVYTESADIISSIQLAGDRQNKIIDALIDIMGELETAAAEDEFDNEQDLIDKFYPLRGYSFIFEPRKFLILGQKGVGKTALFNALKNNRYAKALAQYLKVNINQYENTEWVVGISEEDNYVDIFSCLKSEEQKRAFLYYHTVNILLQHDESLKKIVLNKESKVIMERKITSEWCDLLTSKISFELSEILRKINSIFIEQNRVVTIIYDSLDRVVSAKDRSGFVSALIDMWYMHESILQNIKSKIFLRKDIYDREVEVADKVKLKNYSSTIGWEYDQLFTLLWKRAISKSTEFKSLYEETTGQKLEPINNLGYIPISNEQENKSLLAVLIGVRMGSGKKAFTYNWFRNRLADTQDIIVPRSIIDIFAKASEREKQLRENSTIQITKSILRPKAFEDVLPEISEKRVIDLKDEFKEYVFFLNSLKDTIQRSPVDSNNLQAALRKAGFETPIDEIQNLINIGILRKYQRKSSDIVRYHFPDIYLYGLGLQRLGTK